MIAALVVSVMGQAYCAPVYRQTYQAYRAPTYQTYAAPTYQYQAPTYTAPYDSLYLGYPRDPASYAGVMAQQQRATAAEKAQESLAADVAAIKQYLATAAAPARPSEGGSLTQQLGVRPDGTLVAPGKPDPTPAAPPPNPAPGDPQFGAPPPPPVPAAKVDAIKPPPAVTAGVLGKRCVECHAEGSANLKGFPMFTAGGAVNVDAVPPLRLLQIVTRVNAGTMPPREKGGRLPAVERAAVIQWADENSGPISRALAAALDR